MRRLTLVRHATTAWNEEGRAVGRTNLPLSARGMRQAELLRDRLAGQSFAHACASDQVRAMATATAILAAHPGVPLDHQALLREVDFGRAEGHPFAELEPSEGALLMALAVRLEGWLADVETRMPEGHLLVVAHGGPLRVLLCLLLGLPAERHWSFRLDCAGVSVVDCAPGLATLRLLNDCCHLAGEDDRT